MKFFQIYFPVFIVLIAFNFELSAQVDSTYIDFVAYWSIGDSYDFKVTKKKRMWKNEELTKNDSTQYLANFKVIDSTEKSYTVQWTIKKNLFSTFRKNLDVQFTDKQAVKEIVKKYNVTKIIYKTDEFGEFIEIINWRDISKLINQTLKELERSLVSKDEENRKQIKKSLDVFIKTYSSKRGVEELVISELQYFHFPLGGRYDIDVPLEYEQELPNFLKTGAIKGNAVLSIIETDFDEYYCVLKEEVTLNPEDAKNQIIALFKKMGFKDKEVNETIANAVLDISDLNYYQYYYDPGIPHRVYGSRTTMLKMEESTVENLEEVEIALIYEE